MCAKARISGVRSKRRNVLNTWVECKHPEAGACRLVEVNWLSEQQKAFRLIPLSLDFFLYDKKCEGATLESFIEKHKLTDVKVDAGNHEACGDWTALVGDCEGVIWCVRMAPENHPDLPTEYDRDGFFPVVEDDAVGLIEEGLLQPVPNDNEDRYQVILAFEHPKTGVTKIFEGPRDRSRSEARQAFFTAIQSKYPGLKIHGHLLD